MKGQEDKNYQISTLFYYLKCEKHTENINLRVSKTINGKTMTLSKGAIFGS